MKYFVNILWAFFMSWFSRSIIRQHVHSPEMQQLTFWIFDVPLEMQIAVIWALLSFHRSFGHMLSLIMHALLRGVSYAAQGAGQVVEHTWKYRAGRIALGVGAAYLIYHLIY